MRDLAAAIADGLWDETMHDTGWDDADDLARSIRQLIWRRRVESRAALVWGIAVGLVAFGLLLALTACGPSCHTYPSGTVECQTFPEPMAP